MLHKDFTSQFKRLIKKISYKEGIDLGVAVSKRLYPGYERFVVQERWGDLNVLNEGIRLCELAKTEKIEVAAMLERIDSIIPERKDFRSNTSYAENAALAVYETLQYIKDKDPQHIYNVGTYLIDNEEEKLDEQIELTDEEVDANPNVHEARQFLLEFTEKQRAWGYGEEVNKKFSLKNLFGFGK